jgi:hypothetical protein
MIAKRFGIENISHHPYEIVFFVLELDHREIVGSVRSVDYNSVDIESDMQFRVLNGESG